MYLVLYFRYVSYVTDRELRNYRFFINMHVAYKQRFHSTAIDR